MGGILNGMWTRPGMTWPVRVRGFTVHYPGTGSLLAIELKQPTFLDPKGPVNIGYEATLSPVAVRQSLTLKISMK